MASVSISVISPQNAGVSFRVTVIVSGAPLGASVTAGLSANPGALSFGPAVQASVGVDLPFVFDVTIPTPRHVSFGTNVSDEVGTFYPGAPPKAVVVQ